MTAHSRGHLLAKKRLFCWVWVARAPVLCPSGTCKFASITALPGCNIQLLFLPHRQHFEHNSLLNFETQWFSKTKMRSNIGTFLRQSARMRGSLCAKPHVNASYNFWHGIFWGSYFRNQNSHHRFACNGHVF